MSPIFVGMGILALPPKEEGVFPSPHIYFAYAVMDGLVWSTFTGRKNRARFMRWLASVGDRSGSAQEKAASVTCLLSGSEGGDAASNLTKASTILRAQPLSTLSRENLVNSKPDPALYADSVSAQFGEIHAFMSHSWSDDGNAKYDKLHEWAKEGPEGEKLIWLDKSCIDQKNIDESLAALPIFLAACQKLLILAGPSYPTRLWCVMEIFVFMRVNGKGDDLVVKLLNRHTNLVETFKSFKAEKSRTFLEEDRQRLLAIIEAAFGAFTPFDRIVRTAFDDKLTQAHGIKDAGASFKKAGGRRLSLSVSDLVSRGPDMPTEVTEIGLEENSTPARVMVELDTVK